MLTLPLTPFKFRQISSMWWFVGS